MLKKNESKKKYIVNSVHLHVISYILIEYVTFLPKNIIS
jgi:hypothetical protein